MVGNTDAAVSMASHQVPAIVGEYTVAPIYFEGGAKGGHHWIIEFEKAPSNLDNFANALDRCLQSLNSDYEAKRSQNLALDQLIITPVPKGTFLKLMRSKGKVGGQNKIPRLSNSREFIEELLNFVKANNII